MRMECCVCITLGGGGTLLKCLGGMEYPMGGCGVFGTVARGRFKVCFKSDMKFTPSSPGDGQQFPRNPKTDEVLERLAHELAQAEIARRS
jgi:hypothetical protein